MASQSHKHGSLCVANSREKEFVDSEWLCQYVTTRGSNRFRVKSYYKNFNSLLVDLFTLRIDRSNPLSVFALKRFVSLVFLNDHIYVLFTFLLFALYDLSLFNLDLIINLSNHLTNILG